MFLGFSVVRLLADLSNGTVVMSAVQIGLSSYTLSWVVWYLSARAPHLIKQAFDADVPQGS